MATEAEGKLAQALIKARTLGHITQIQKLAEAIYGPLGKQPLGGRENNIGTVRLGSDPALALVERVTNGMDALLDLGKARNPSDNPSSPVEAGQMWYGLPRAGIQEMAEEDRRRVGEMLQVWLDESGEASRPTVVVEDRGIGITPADMPKTILSLNENNKVGQRWNMGTYGQGGSGACGFARATLIFSRRHPDLLGEDEERVGWTVIIEHETDPSLNILPSYKYWVDEDGRIPSLPGELFPDLPHGTRVTSVAYDLQGWTGPFTTGIWQMLHAAVFEPVLPFLVTGYRKKERTYGSRIVIGNAARLERPEDRSRGELTIAHMDSTKLELGTRYGHVSFKYWVLRRPEGSKAKSDPTASYVRPSDAIAITLYGQRQDAESRIWIKNRAYLPFLYKNMVVQVNANGLTPIAKRELFASTRERATKSELRERIYEHLAEVLREDPQLKYLNHLERERLLERSTTASSEKVRKRLAKFIKTHLRNVQREGGGSSDPGKRGNRKPKPGGPAKGRDTSDDHLHTIPTYLKFSRPKLHVHQGHRAHTWVEVDAKNGYLPEQEDALSLQWVGVDPGGDLRQTMRSRLLGGKSRWYFEAEPDAPICEYTFRAELITPTGVIGDTVVVEVRVPPKAKEGKKGTEPETGPRVEWVRQDSWEDHEFTQRSVGRVTEDDETIIWVNRDYHLLKRALKGRNLTADAVETRATRYQFPVACALWLQHDQLRNANPEPSEEYQRTEQERLAEAVLIAIDPDVDAALIEGED